MRLPAGIAASRGLRRTSLPALFCSVPGIMVLLAGLGAVLPALAQSAQTPVYTIRAGDTLNIQVAGHEEWSVSVGVRPDGRITYPATGEIEVAGLTVADLTERLEYALGPGGRHLRAPNVIINVVGLRTPVAYVLGAVARSGAVEIPTGVSIATKILTMAGGATAGADLSRVTVYRDDGSRDVLNLEAELAGDVEATVVRAGDVLMIPEKLVRFVGVLGAVGRSGEVLLQPHQPSINMLELLVKIGGVGEKADAARAMILRENGTIDSVDLSEVLAHTIEPPLLYGGDVLWVPTLPPDPETEYFAVTGAVQSPGRFEHREGITLADALAISGQPGEAANPENVTIIHADGEKEIIDIRPMLYGQDTDIARTPIQAGDIVLVPARDKSYVMLGAVARTGFFPWDENTRLADALARSGGLSPNAVADRVALVRRTPDGGTPTVLEIDARKLLQGENEAANWKLQPGDTVYVPLREEKGIQKTLSEPLALLGILGALERVFNW